MKKVWFVDFPLSQYNEDVLALADANSLTVLNNALKDALNLSADIIEQSPPALTPKG